MDVLKKYRGIIIVTVCLIIGIGVYFIVNLNNKKKSEEVLQKAITYLKENNYEEAIKNLEESTNLDSENIKAMRMLELTSGYEAIKRACIIKDYRTAGKILEELKSNEYVDLIKENLELIGKDVDEKISVMDKIDNFDNYDSSFGKYLLINRYDMCEDIIKEYMRVELSDEYRVKLNLHSEKLKAEKIKYEAEQVRLAEEKRKREEEENKKRFNIFSPNRQLTEEEAKKLMYYRVGNTYDGSRVEYKEEGGRKMYSGYYVLRQSAVYFIDVDSMTGEVNIHNPGSRWEKYTGTESEIKLGTGYGWVESN